MAQAGRQGSVMVSWPFSAPVPYISPHHHTLSPAVGRWLQHLDESGVCTPSPREGQNIYSQPP